tara:strand:+ start:8809 stop:9969 length:1161 start_codon:yes stop_codon:yes gene_type:complete
MSLVSKKVIYVSWVKLTDKYARDYFIDHLIENGVEVEFWDVVALTREQHNEVGELDVNYLRVLQSYRDLENLVKRSENIDAVYVMLMTLNWKVRLVYQLLSKYRRKMVFLRWGEVPAKTAPILQRAVNKLITAPFGFFQSLFDTVGLISYKKLGLIKPFHLVFTAGSVLRESEQFAKKTKQLNSPDYDHYMHLKESDDSFVDEKYAVFLDLSMPYNSDLILDGKKTINPHDYYQSLNRFFTLLEEQYGVKVIIAAHPKTNPNTTAFGDREIYRLRTAEIVKDAEFVITHHSTALNYAVLNVKPCIFIYTNEMEVLYPNSRVGVIKLFADYLDASIYNIDKLKNPENIVMKQPNRIRYDDYKYSFLTSKATKNSTSNDIFFQEINQS